MLNELINYQPSTKYISIEREKAYRNLEFITEKYLWLPPIMSGKGGLPSLKEMTLTGGKSGFKIFSSDNSTPLMRLDFEQHTKNPENHLQYGGSENNGFNPQRSGNDAVDVFVETFVKNPKINFVNPSPKPWEDAWKIKK